MGGFGSAVIFGLFGLRYPDTDGRQEGCAGYGGVHLRGAQHLPGRDQPVSVHFVYCRRRRASVNAEALTNLLLAPATMYQRLAYCAVLPELNVLRSLPTESPLISCRQAAGHRGRATWRPLILTFFPGWRALCGPFPACLPRHHGFLQPRCCR